MKKRSSGILLHITSLPSPYGVGDIGPGAYRFADFLMKSRQDYWQVLPLNPTSTVCGNSPYTSISPFAGNTLLVSPDRLVEEGYLTKKDLEPLPESGGSWVDYDAACAYKERVLDVAYRRMKEKKRRDPAFVQFCEENAYWLEDFALFKALKTHFGGRVWSEWPVEVRDRHDGALAHFAGELADLIAKERFLQYLFYHQWHSLRKYCNERGIQIIGDLPIYVNYDSVDVWTCPHLFKLDGGKHPYVVAGVPPDYFSATGQRWGNPVYNWDSLRQQGFFWWVKRMEHTFDLFNVVRIDHFRGLVAYWEIPAHEQTAVNGRWVDAPVDDFFNTLLKHFAYLPIIVEDLGLITSDVREVVQKYFLPGMKVLVFAFGEDKPMHPYLPHMYERNSVVYTGTHDTNTVRGWFERETKPEDRGRLFAYAGRELSADEVSWALVRLALMSPSNLAIIPLQDILGLGEDTRMNRPSESGAHNWRWRAVDSQLTDDIAARFASIVAVYGRG